MFRSDLHFNERTPNKRAQIEEVGFLCNGTLTKNKETLPAFTRAVRSLKRTGRS